LKSVFFEDLSIGCINGYGWSTLELEVYRSIKALGGEGDIAVKLIMRTLAAYGHEYLQHSQWILVYA
jgi:hypothetical protein